MRRPATIGFTLIELLVAMAIISILAALLLPALSRARFQAQMLQCMARQKQVGVMVLAYTGDYGDILPYPAWDDCVTGSQAEYIQVKFCPYADETAYNPYKSLLKPGWMYCMNKDLTTRSIWEPGPVRLNELRWPYGTMVLSDGCWRGRTFTHRNDYIEQTFFGRGSPYASPPHHIKLNGGSLTQGINLTYVDGHAKFMQSFFPETTAIAGSDPRYPMNYKRFWGREGTQSWDLAPFP